MFSLLYCNYSLINLLKVINITVSFKRPAQVQDIFSFYKMWNTVLISSVVPIHLELFSERKVNVDNLKKHLATFNFKLISSFISYLLHVRLDLPIHSSTLGPPCIHTSILYACISMFALQISSSVTFFQIPYICINIQSFSFSNFTLDDCLHADGQETHEKMLNITNC